MVRIGWTSHCGFVQEKTSACGGGARTLHSAPHARGPQEREGTLEFKVTVSGTPYLSSYHRLRALLQEILEVFSLVATETARALSLICGELRNSLGASAIDASHSGRDSCSALSMFRAVYILTCISCRSKYFLWKLLCTRKTGS